MWGIFVWTVLPSGALLTALLLSASPLAVAVSCRVLSTPVRINAFQLSLASLMSAISAAVAFIAFMALRRAHVRMEQTNPIASALGQDYRQQTSAFHWGRNLYMSLLGLTLWLSAWRLKTLAETGQLLPPRASGRRMTIVMRAIYFVVGFCGLLMADIPLCRLNYNMQLTYYVTPEKEKLLNAVGPCQNAMYGDGNQRCKDFCDKSWAVSRERLDTIMSARNQHILGKFAAEFFDDTRGVEQGEGRMQELFNRKTCEQVLQSVDKSNMIVNAVCMGFAGIAIIGAFSCISSAYSGEAPNMEPSAPPMERPASAAPPVQRAAAAAPPMDNRKQD